MSNCISIAALIVSIVSAFIYWCTLKEQQKQSNLLLQQHFYEQWQELIRQQLKIRDDMHITIDVLRKDEPTKIQINGSLCLTMLWRIFKRLAKAIEYNYDYTNWEELEAGYDHAMENIPDELQYYDVKEYNEICNAIGEKRLISFVGHTFGVTKKVTKSSNPEYDAFLMIYERYFRGSSTYFTHLCSMLHFLDRSKNAYSTEVDECVQILKDNMSSFELGIVEQYLKYDKYNGQKLKEYLFNNANL